MADQKLLDTVKEALSFRLMVVILNLFALMMKIKSTLILLVPAEVVQWL